MRLSLVIPCYNEAGSLPKLVDRLAEAIPPGRAEVVLVDNGSRDETARLLPGLIHGHENLRVCTVPENQGYGFGILSGLRVAEGDVLAWTHADLQADPADAMAGLSLFGRAADPERLFVKGRRHGRPLRDRVFEWGMSLFELPVLGSAMWDINAQPTMFHRAFFERWDSPPADHCLDLFAYSTARRQGLRIERIPVIFGPRLSGFGHNETLRQKLATSRRTISYSLDLRRRIRRGP